MKKTEWKRKCLPFLESSLVNYLDTNCISDYQVAYNVLNCMWIMSYHHYALPVFENFKLNAIEKVLKILDFFSKEKIVRIILLIFENLMRSDICLEIMSDIQSIDVSSMT
jgi:hypothetical protein